MVRSLLLAIGLCALSHVAAWKDECASFASSYTSDTSRIVATSYYPAGAFVNLTNFAGPVSNSSLPDFCRVQLNITTNPETGSSAATEVWLPDAWNSRLMGLGNGGYFGAVNLRDLAFTAVKQGYAGFSSNIGHDSSNVDGSWALNDEDAIIDYSYRALHLSTIEAKSVVKTYYGRAHKTSVFSGCSSGGRQAMKSIQEYPEDFDALAVGSPSVWRTHFNGWRAHINQVIRPENTSEPILSVAELEAVAAAIVGQCDELDGVKDSVISNPEECLNQLRSSSFSALACKAKQTSDCWSAAQINAIERLHQDYVDGEEYLYSGYLPGTSGVARVLGPTGDPLAIDYFRYFLYNDTDWNFLSYNRESLRFADQINPGRLNSIEPTLAGFQARGGKLIHYVGTSDAENPAGNSRWYRNQVAQANGGDIDDFYRLIEAPGMNHCSGGRGPNAFGGALQTAGLAPPLEFNAKYDIVSAVLKWYEEGDAPDKLIATKYNGDSYLNGVNFTRPLCVYPKKVHYGGGDQDKAESFYCQ